MTRSADNTVDMLFNDEELDSIIASLEFEPPDLPFSHNDYGYIHDVYKQKIP